MIEQTQQPVIVWYLMLNRCARQYRNTKIATHKMPVNLLTSALPYKALQQNDGSDSPFYVSLGTTIVTVEEDSTLRT